MEGHGNDEWQDLRMRHITQERAGQCQSHIERPLPVVPSPWQYPTARDKPRHRMRSVQMIHCLCDDGDLGHRLHAPAHNWCSTPPIRRTAGLYSQRWKHDDMVALCASRAYSSQCLSIYANHSAMSTYVCSPMLQSAFECIALSVYATSLLPPRPPCFVFLSA